MCPELASSITLIFESEELNLPLPNKGDTNNFKDFAIRRRNRGNEIRVFRDPRWPIENIIDFKIGTLTDSVKDQLENFIDKSLGKEITLINHYGVSVPCFILINDNVEFVEERDCAFSVELRFQKL